MRKTTLVITLCRWKRGPFAECYTVTDYRTAVADCWPIAAPGSLPVLISVLADHDIGAQTPPLRPPQAAHSLQLFCERAAAAHAPLWTPLQLWELAVACAPLVPRILPEASVVALLAHTDWDAPHLSPFDAVRPGTTEYTKRMSRLLHAHVPPRVLAPFVRRGSAGRAQLGRLCDWECEVLLRALIKSGLHHCDGFDTVRPLPACLLRALEQRRGSFDTGASVCSSCWTRPCKPRRKAAAPSTLSTPRPILRGFQI